MSKIRLALTLTAFLSLALPCAARPSTASDVAADPALMLVERETFEAMPRGNWVFPSGWTRAAAGEGFALRATAAQAGLDSAVRTDGIFGDVAVQGQFTFDGAFGTARLFARASAAGSYVAQLDAAGWVTLEKRGPAGALISSWRAESDPQALPGAARTLLLSAIGGALRVTVDGIDVLTVDDLAPLPAGANKIGAAFAVPTGTLTFDNYLVWVPSDELESPAPVVARLALADGFDPQPIDPPEPASTNDDFANRLVVTTNRYTHVANNSAGAANEVDEPAPACAPDAGKTVWYEFTPLATGSYLLTSVGSNFNTVIAVYTGAPGALVPLACNDNVTGSLQARLTLSLTGAQTYYIQLGGRSGSGNFKFYVADPSDTVVPSTPIISATAAGAPSTPVASGGRTNSLSPVVAWAPRPTVTPYDYVVQVSTVPTFATIAAMAVIQDPTRYWEIAPSLAAPDLPAGKVYYWRVAARNYFGQASLPSAAYSFTIDQAAPNPPVLSAPALNGVASTLRPVFTWGAVAEASGYRVRIASNFSCSTTVLEAEVATTVFTPAVDIQQGEYWYCVQARDLAGNWSAFGEKRRFVINISLTPVSGTNVIAVAPAYAPNVVLTWTRITGATYHLQIAEDSAFTVIALDQDVTVPTFTFASPYPGVYYWRVAVNGNDLPAPLARSFNVTPALPLAPGIPTTGVIGGAVTNGGVTNDLTPTFQWSVPANWVTWPPGQSITYELQVSTLSTFATLTGSAQGIMVPQYTWQVTDAALMPATTYYWRVRAVTNFNVPGAWSAAFRFTTDTVPLAPPTLLTPTANANVTTPRPTVTWAPVAGANLYRVRISDEPTCTVNRDFAQVATTVYTVTAFNLQQDEYWFCVAARDLAGNWSDYSTPRRFVINVALTPADGSTVIASAPLYTPNVTFTWAKVTGANSYNVEIASLPDFTDGILGSQVTATTLTMPSMPVGKYYWRVYVDGDVVPIELARSFVVTPALPTSPAIQLTGTASGAVANGGSSNAPVLDWTVPANWVTPVAGQSIFYEVQLATNIAFSPPADTFPNLVDSNFSVPTGGLIPGTRYYWRVRGVTGLGAAGPFSAVYSFTYDVQATTVPVLSIPAVNGVVATLRPAFTWVPPVGAAGYRVRITSNFSCSTTVLEAEVAAASFTPAVDLPQAEHWYCVESRDAAGNWSGFGEKRRFVVNVALTPANGTNIIAVAPSYSPNVVFSWTRVTGATYDIEIADDSSFSGTVITASGLTNPTYTLTGRPMGTYYWRVRVNGNSLPQSLARSFSITPALPVAPLIQTTGAAPTAVANGAITSNATPTFDWMTPTNWVPLPQFQSLTYELQVSTSVNFAAPVAGTPVVGIPDTKFDMFFPLTPGLYYWRVRAITNLGLAGAFSPVYSFTVDTVAPLTPVLAAPAVDGVVSVPRPLFTWAAPVGATGYRIRIASDPMCAAITVVEATVATASYTSTVDLPQGEYWYCVESRDVAGNWSGFGEVRRFVVNYSLAPANGASIIAAAPAFTAPVTMSWTKITGVPNYRIQVSTDPGFIALAADSGITALTTYTMPAKPPGKYYWRILINGSPTFPTSLARSFTITPALPVGPVIQTVGALPGAVTNAGFTNNTTPVFDWTVPANWVTPPAGGSLTYQLQVSTNATFTAIVADVNGLPDSNHTLAVPIESAKTYYWRVRAITNLGVMGPYSATYSFGLDTTDPVLPASLTAPANLAVLTAARPLFSWVAGTNGATRYRFEIGSNPEFSSIFYTATVATVSHTPTVSLPQGTYYWHVYAIDAAGNETDEPTAYRTFTVDFRTGPTADKQIPATTVNGTQVAFTWVAPTGAPVGTSYTIEIDADLDGVAETTLGPVTTFSATSPVLAPGYYQYRLTVGNGLGTSEWRAFVILPR